MHQTESDRHRIMQHYPDFYYLATTAVLIGIGVVIGWLLFANERLDGYFTNVWTEALGIGVTVLVIDRLNSRRAIQERKDELILQMGSPINSAAIEAERILRQKGWLQDGSLQNAKLGSADLSSADLSEANLPGARLYQANLSNTDLSKADLSGADLSKADLSGVVFLIRANLSDANLSEANLSGAVLWNANLSDARLYKANLSEAYLFGANLSGADLERVIFDPTTTLPDGSKWTPGSDLDRFTDPKHPNFRRSDDPESPAYRGKTE